MKKIIFYSALVWLIGCNGKQTDHEETADEAMVTSPTSSSDNQESDNIRTAVTNNSRLLTRLLRDIASIETETSENPIAEFSEIAKEQADEMISLNKGNAASVFEKAIDYQHCFIVTEDHTIAKIISFTNCQTSGSWGTCMPRAVGYIKKGDFTHQEGYVNNIIGRPDNQSRTVFLFK